MTKAIMTIMIFTCALTQWDGDDDQIYDDDDDENYEDENVDPNNKGGGKRPFIRGS